MKYMLDTNVCVDLIRNCRPTVVNRLRALHPDAVCISAVTLSELEYGAARSADPARNRLLTAEFITPLDIRAYDDAVGPSYGRVRAELEARGEPIGPLDTMIAAHALSLGLVLVTNNEREFRRVPGLRVENWAG